MATPGRTATKVMTGSDRWQLSASGDNEEQPAQIMEYEQLGLKTFEYTEHKLQDMKNDINCENNFSNSTHNHCDTTLNISLTGPPLSGKTIRSSA